MANKKPLYAVITIDVVVVLIIAYLAVNSKKKTATPPADTNQAQTNQIPTYTPEQLEVIAKVETVSVEIINNAFSPASITVKANDQVQWTNKDNVNHQVKGENWGNLVIAPDKKFTQAFKDPGVYQYFDQLNPEIKGTVIVK